MAASRRLRDLQSQLGNKICVDCSQRNPQWASVSYGVFMCLECSGKHRGLGVHISFVRSVTMDSWSEVQLKKMEAGGNDLLNSFFSQYGILKETDTIPKYNSEAASIYRDRIQALAEGRQWRDPPVVKNSVGFGKSKPPLGNNSGSRIADSGGIGGWDGWENDDPFRSDMRRNQSTGDFRGYGPNGEGGAPVRSRSTENIYSRSQLQASALNKDCFFANKIAENESRPEGIHPSKGGKYVGFGSTPPPRPHSSCPNRDAVKDTVSVLSQGLGRFSLVAASAAHSAASAVHAGTRGFASKVKEGGYDYKVNETVSVVTAKTSEIGQKTWGVMKGVMAMASQKVEEYTKEGAGSSKFGHDNENGWYDHDEGNPGEKDGGGHAKCGGGGDDWAGWDDDDDTSTPVTATTTATTDINKNDGGKWAGRGGFE